MIPSPRKFYIGLCGPQRAGKTVLAASLALCQNQLVQPQPSRLHWACDSFAEPLYEMARLLVGLPEGQRLDKAQLYQVSSHLRLTGREVLQLLGTECVREHFGYDTWVYSLIQRSQARPEEVVLIDDVRFPEELAILDYLIYLETTPNLHQQQADQHKSEQAQQLLKSRANLLVTRGPLPYEYTIHPEDLHFMISEVVREKRQR